MKSGADKLERENSKNRSSAWRADLPIRIQTYKCDSDTDNACTKPRHTDSNSQNSNLHSLAGGSGKKVIQLGKGSRRQHDILLASLADVSSLTAGMWRILHAQWRVLHSKARAQHVN